jgi:hypothetical protein
MRAGGVTTAAPLPWGRPARTTWISLIMAIGAGLVAAVATARVHVEPTPVPDATASIATAVEGYARLTSAFAEDARRCAADLRKLAARRPLPTARALELDGPAVAASAGAEALAALSLRAIADGEDVAARAVRRSVGARDAEIAPAAERAGRAHAAADRLCAARDAAMAATLRDPRAARPGSR